MKKSLVALAALAATSAFAQSSVTLSGNIDFAYANVGGTQLWAKGSTVSTTVGTASTSVINIVAVEDLGGGMKVTGKYGIDPRTLANDSYAVTNNTGLANSFGGQAGALPGMAGTSGTTVAAASGANSNSTLGTVGGQANTATGFARDEVFVGIEGGFGNLRLGAPNSIGLNSFQVASPAGTGIGSGYTGAGTSGTMTNSFVQTRYNRSVRYDSPVINGFTLSYQYAPGNDQAPAVTANGVIGSTSAVSPSLPVPYLIPNARAATEYGVRYANGPLTVSYANVAQDAQVNSTGWYATGSSTKGLKTSVNLLNASYAMGNTTLYVGWNDGDRLAPIGSAGSSATANVATKGNRMAIKQTMGKLDVMASITTQEALGVTNVSGSTYTTATLKAKVTGLRAEYNLSKTAAIYGGYEKYDTGNDYVAAALTSTGNRTLTSVGLKKSF